MRTPLAPPAPPLLDRIRRGLIGDDEVLEGPYGPRRLVYGPASPPLRLTDVRFTVEGQITAPAVGHRRPGEEALSGQLDRAREVFAHCSDLLDDGPTGLPADFERMRWFPLPPVCLEQTRPGTG
ncbi:hypothetical protein OG568_08805 [Streptomyces sp. NBC_01450]|uniref:hypothetical protein n=1 Tax=Streptomyces sp. NBC_01450 TaxID=2903871 RepID=UPI002E354CDC|nr:hypothetical protein [Streptomyces sp. NBC_01450]